jgi:hypothetical protein
MVLDAKCLQACHGCGCAVLDRIAERDQAQQFLLRAISANQETVWPLSSSCNARAENWLGVDAEFTH